MDYLREFLTEPEIDILPRLSSWGISSIDPQKRAIGFKVKRLLDYGRCLYIERQLGMVVHPHQYCDPIKESPECILLLGITK